MIGNNRRAPGPAPGVGDEDLGRVDVGEGRPVPGAATHCKIHVWILWIYVLLEYIVYFPKIFFRQFFVWRRGEHFRRN